MFIHPSSQPASQEHLIKVEPENPMTRTKMLNTSKNSNSPSGNRFDWSAFYFWFALQSEKTLARQLKFEQKHLTARGNRPRNSRSKVVYVSDWTFKGAFLLLRSCQRVCQGSAINLFAELVWLEPKIGKALRSSIE